MVSVIIIPIVMVVIIGLAGYLIYRYALFDAKCKSSVNKTLKRYNIQKTPFEIIEEFYQEKGEALSDKEIKNLERQYRQGDPDQFLAMYDRIREGKKEEKKD